MNDYRVGIKVRNNRILKAIEEAGGTPGDLWCKPHGLSYVTINKLINMTCSPMLGNGDLTPNAKRLCEVLNKLPEELWADDQLRPLEKNFTSLEMSREQVLSLTSSGESSYLPAYDEAIDKERLVKVMEQALSTLDKKYQHVLKARFFEDKTLEEIGRELGVGRERISQMERKGLRMLRAPSKSKTMVPFLDNYKEPKQIDISHYRPGDIIWRK